MVRVIIHERFAVVALAVRIDIMNLCRVNAHFPTGNSRFLEINDAVEVIILVIVSKRTNEEVVLVVIHTSAQVFPVPIANA